jgi:zinc metalloprotease ZmpA
MTQPTLRRIAAAAWAVLAAGTTATSALAATADDNSPAVLRALGHLQAQSLLSTTHDSFELRDLIVDDDGTEHVRFDRRFQGLRVIGGDVVVHDKLDGTLGGLNRTFTGALSTLSVVPTLAANVVGPIAQKLFVHTQGTVESTELVVYARGSVPLLAWDVLVSGVQADGTPSETHFILSALTGRRLDQWDDIHTADAKVTGKTLDSGNVTLHADRNTRGVYTLVDATRGSHSTVTMANGTSTESTVASTTSTFGNNALSNKATVAADAAYGQAMTWDYFLNTFGRKGVANDGKGARSRVHYGNNYVNAFWSDNCFCMTYGDGDNGVNYYPLVQLDVAGHEMTHGITFRTAGLTYSGESGGLNEGTSDIFGTMVEFYANNAKDTPDYLIGEKVFVNGGALRDMAHPSRDGSSADCWYSNVGSLDVHYSSGVANHFFYLLAEGTQSGSPSPTCRSGDTRSASGTGTLTGIGRTKAAKIWYRALTVYMTSNTNYASARTATVQAATDLYGASSTEVAAVKAAWTAVNRS